ncbi:MAG: type IV secretion protein IcmK [Proteobacteria bacterium]|nr:type IV secretion protein IcmK [Pseudomonadota bacterium]
MKKVILISIALFIVLDISLLGAAQVSSEKGEDAEDLKQLQQLQQNVQQLSASTSEAAKLEQIRQQQELQRQQQQPSPNPSGPQSTNIKPMPSAAEETGPILGPNGAPVLPSSVAPATTAGQGPAPATPATDPNAANNAAQQQQPESTDPLFPNDPLREAAFQAAVTQKFPMTPDQIKALRRVFEETQFAAQNEVTTPPRPTASSQFVSLAPGATPPVIRLAKGFVSSLVFLDSTGAPWPIAAYDLGNPQAFNVVWDRKSNTLMIQASQLYTYGNLAVRLQGLSTPVMLTLIPGQKAVDYRQDLRVQGLGPNAQTIPTGGGLPEGTNTLLLSVLDGVPPTGSKALTVNGGSAEVWLLGEKIYVRTHLTVLSPGWLSTMSSADGTKVYEMLKTPILLVSQHGKLIQLKIEGL